MTVHGSKEFFDVARQGLARKVAAARFVVCISDFTRSQLMALVDDTHWPRLHVVHCGIDPEHFAPPEAGRPGDGPLRVLTVGRLDNMKGVAILVEAVGELRRRGVAVALTVVGDGPQREHLQRLAERNAVGEAITWAGPVGQDTIRAHYHAADVFCLPSFAEGIPVVLMEAMSTGLPVVANGITGIPELVEHEVSGLLVRPGRTDLLVGALQRLAADGDLRARMGEAGREKVRREFASRDVGAALAELFAASWSRRAALSRTPRPSRPARRRRPCRPACAGRRARRPRGPSGRGARRRRRALVSARTKAAVSRGSTTKPVSPSSTRSRAAPAWGEQMSGRPAAAASSRTIPKVSPSVGKRERVGARQLRRKLARLDEAGATPRR